MSQQIKFPIGKRQMIESQCMNGKCYLRLLAMLPSFANCQPSELEDAIVNMASGLGANPKGVDVIGSLWFANGIMAGDSGVADPNDSEGLDFVTDLMDCCARFGYEEINGVKHISYYLIDDTCEETFCEHGWSARFILCMIASRDVLVGAEIDMSDFFAAIEEELEVESEDSWEKNTVMRANSRLYTHDHRGNTASELDDKNRDIERLNRQVEELTALQTKTLETSMAEVQMLKTTLDEQIGKSKTRDRLAGSLLSKLRSTKPAKVEESVLPDDSSSQIGRYTSNKRFMEEGTVYSINGVGTRKLDSIEEVPQLSVSRNVVKGYVRTHDMQKTEMEMVSKVAPINGLANPFRSERLNLLCHFHTAIDSLKPKQDTFTNYDAICYLHEFQSKTPSEELAYKMITQTFNLKTNTIIANPYKIPFLEVGMCISDDALAKSLDMLRLEYKILWFEEMKSLKVPQFHDSYNAYREYKVTRGTHDKPKVANSKVRSKSKPSNNGGSSVLSFIRS